MSTQDGSIINGVPNIPLTEDANFIRYVESKQNGEQFFVLELRSERMQEHYQYLKTIPAFKAYFDYAVSVGFDLPETQIHHLANFSHGNLLFITLEPCPEFHDVFKRFAAVFEQTYIRFNDLKQAEAQARESQVQLALERVRARTMAMQRSDELPGAATILFQQVQSLGMPAFAAGYCIWDEDKQAITLWMSSEGILQPPFKAPTTEDELFIEMRKGHEEGKSFHVVEMGGKKLVAHYQYMRTLPVVGEIFDSIIEAGHPLPTFQIMHHAYFSKGFLLFITYEPVPDAHDIFKRFGKVFEQTYTRFLDLQKAEAQAREAKIEAALERVRARTMGMQKSDELADVVGLMYKQFEELDFGFYKVLVSIYDIKNNVIEWWSRGFGDVELPQRNILPIIDHPFSNDLLKKWKNGVDSYQHILEGEMKKSWEEHLFTQTDLKHFPQEIKDKMRSFDHVFLTDVFMKYGSLQAAGNAPLPGDKEKILKRFTKALDHAYTRMMDLQNAEAQTREAQIEAALERVRSKTMAMQRSEELDSVIKSVYSELKHLDVSFDRCFIMIFDEQKGATWWMGSPEDDLFHEGFYVQYHTHPPHLAYLKGWEERQQKWEYLLGGQIKKDWDEFIFYETGLSKLPPIAIQYMKSFDSAHLAASFENFGCMTTGGQERLSEESFSILSRFAKVFDQTYTRFNDLKQAEAQARESQIEAALEKIRSRSLAMHHSKELKEVIAITFEKLNELNVLPGTVAIQLFDKKSMHSVLWVGNTIQDPQMVDLPYDKQMMLEDTLLKDGWQAMIEGIDIINKEYSVEQKNKYFNYLFSNNNLTQIPEQAREVLRQMQSHIACLFVEKNSAFLVDSWKGEFFPKENLHVLKRAAKVFEQAYIRFLDLQKAEAQARESQIEAALERVRSRTMAMQKSDELKDVIQVVYEQFVHLNVNVEHTGFIMDHKERNDMHIWLADKHAVPFQVTIPYFDCAHWNSFNEAKEKGIDFFANKLSFEEKNKFYQDLFKLIPDLPEETLKYYFSCPGLAISTVLLENVGLYIENFSGIPFSDEENKTLMRFGKVFQQTYTRFLDLQRAEAQAKEARIEAALERTRTQSMLMQHSDQLDETLRVFHEQVLLIGIPSAFSFLWLPDDQNDKHIFWAAWAERNSGDPSNAYKSKAINYPLDRNDPATAQCLIDWKSGQRVFSYHVPPTGVDAYFAAWKELL